MAASVIVGMVSLPAVSQPDSGGQLPEVAEETPSRELVRSSSPDGFTARISTAFEDFRTSVAAGSANASLTSPRSRLEVDRQPSSTTWRYTSPRGEIVLERTSTEVTERVETPKGTLTTVRKNGAVTESFRGSDRDSVEQAGEKLREAMEEARQRMDEKRRQVRPQPDLELTANDSTASGFGDNSAEYVGISNDGDVAAQLSEYTLQNNNPDSFEIPERNLEPGESVRVYSNSRDAAGGPDSAIYGSGLTWENSGDTARLLRGNETAVEESY